MKLCTKKRLSKKEAQEHLNFLLKTGKMDKGRIYSCNACDGHWHITHTVLLEPEDLKKKDVMLTKEAKWKLLISK